MYDVLSSRKKKLKRFPSLKFRRLKCEIFSVISRNWFQLSPPFSQRQFCIEEEEPEDMLLGRFAEETDLFDWYFIWFLRLDSFWFYQCIFSLNYGLFL